MPPPRGSRVPHPSVWGRRGTHLDERLDEVQCFPVPHRAEPDSMDDEVKTVEPEHEDVSRLVSFRWVPRAEVEGVVRRDSRLPDERVLWTCRPSRRWCLGVVGRDEVRVVGGVWVLWEGTR